MKRFLILVASVLSVMPAGWAAAPFYINNGIVSRTFPPQELPTIDAINFVNNGFFLVTNLFTLQFSQPVEPFETSDTLNYTNHNLMMGDSGFRLDDFDTSSGRYHRSANFVNVGLVNPTNALVFGATYVLVSATNILNRGTLEIGAGGLMNLNGENLDLTRSRLIATNDISTGNFFQTQDSGIQDLYWGVADTDRLSAVFLPDFVQSSPMIVTNSSFVPTFQILTLTNFTSYTEITPFGTNGNKVDVLILGQTNPLITTEVRFFPGFFGQEKDVEWIGYETNRTTGEITTNTLFLSDTMGLDNFTPFLIPSFNVNRRFLFFGTSTFRPSNYTISRTSLNFTNGNLETATPLDPTIFDGTNTTIFVTNTAYGAQINGFAFGVDTNIAGATFTNMAGRIELLADKVLDLTRTRIEGESYLLLNATNHFVGSVGARIVAPFSDIRLSSTNSTLTISNLIYPVVPNFSGTIQVWSGRWTNVDNSGVANRYNVTIVDSQLATTGTGLVVDLELHAPTIYISDALNVLQSLLIDAVRLTITTNAANAPTASGELNILSGDFTWTASFPRLAYLTNFGTLTSSNSFYFAGARTPPFFSGTFDEPYQAFVSHGNLGGNGIDIWANYVELSGSNNSGVGPFNVKSPTMIVTNGSVVSIAAGITFTGNELLISNTTMAAQGPITLDLSGYLNDGSLGTSLSNIRGSNVWTAANGINYLQKATYASLLATTITNTAFPNANVLNQWAAEDRGCNPGGFVNNAAIGHLVLDGGQDSVFTFAGTTGNNALYVGTLELNDYTATRDSLSSFPGVIVTNMHIYFGQAFANGLPISEKLNGANSNSFCWVPAFAINQVALTQVSPTPGITNTPPGSGSGGGGSTAANGAPQLVYPGTSNIGAGGGANPFVTAKGTYNGILYDSNGVTVESSGYLTVSTTALGGYAGKVTLGSKVYTVAGQFNAQGKATKVIPRSGLGALTLHLELDLNGGNQLRGSLAGALWTAQIIADKAGFDKSRNPAPQQGKYTLVIPPADASGNGPAGVGIATAQVDAAGNVQLAGSLADGTKFSQKSALSSQGIFPVYASLYGGSGTLLSWLQFTNQAESDLSGQFVWLKGASIGAKSYAHGFTNEVMATGSHYQAPSSGKKSVEISAGNLTLSGGNLAQPLSFSVTLNSNNKVSGPAGSKLVLKFAPSTGLLNGSVINPDTGKPIPFQGALFQKSNIGLGYFLGAGLSGGVSLEAAP